MCCHARPKLVVQVADHVRFMRDTHNQHVEPSLYAADLLSALQFDSDGHFLATGDQGGRVVLLEQSGKSQSVRPKSGFAFTICLAVAAQAAL